jgi:4-hydroxyproline epimerase
MRRVTVVDSHTAGEPTRVVIEGGPIKELLRLGGASLASQRDVFSEQFDRFRSAVMNEPRGSDVLVGALLTEPVTPGAVVGVIFFNNVGVLGMCGHGLIGVVETLRHLGRIGAGHQTIDTPVGLVGCELHADGRVSLENVESRLESRDVAIQLASGERLTGDLAWGGNWFFLVKEHGRPLELARVDELADLAWSIRQAVNEQVDPRVDHVELFGPPTVAGARSRSFVLCPGNAYDRSPCGTGTSAKMACLAARGDLAPGERWVQESIVGTTFEGFFRWADESRQTIVPTITGQAWITAESTLLFDPTDPFGDGIRVR